MVPHFCRLELPQPSYRPINTPEVFYEMCFYTKFYNGVILNITACAIMPGFHKSGHTCEAPLKNAPFLHL